MSETPDLRALAEAATPGPWESFHDRIAPDTAVVTAEHDESLAVCEHEHEPQFRDADAAFIAAANPTAVLALLDEVDRLRADITAAEQRGREDNADHGMCYVYGSKALEAKLGELDALRAAVDLLERHLNEVHPLANCRACPPIRAALDPA